MEKERKVIELEVMEDLEDSGVSAIALVDSPAIEKYWVYMRNQNFVKPSAGESQSDFMGRCVPVLIDEGKDQDQAVAICISMYEQDFKKEEFESYTDYPESATNAAKRVLAWAEENGWGDCLTPVGKARANQLANREPISEETIARMASFARHLQYKDVPYSEGCGGIGVDAWGGQAGIEWAQNKLESIRAEMGTDTSGLAPYVDEVPKKRKMEAEDCPEATTNIELNLDNRQKAIDKAMYGPLDTSNPGDYWDKVAERWKVPVEEAESKICGNCAAFNITKSMKECIAEGIGEGAEAVIEAGELGYCEFFDFKCAAKRSCLAHVGGGPIREEKFIDPNPCWDGYEAIGLKDNGVPNCVPIKASEFAERPIARIPKEERGRTGSEKNEPGDTTTSRGGIEVSEEVEASLKDKIKEHNEKNPQDSQKADLGMLKAVWRRGAGAFSVGTPGRKGMGRAQWAMGRVNAFLKILSGSNPSDKDYTQDNDLLPKSHPKHSEVKSKLSMIEAKFATDNEKQIIVGPAMVPDMEIFRRDEDTNEEYYVKFSAETIAKIQEKFMAEMRNRETNLEHNSDMDAKSFLFESWIVEDALTDKANSVYKLGVPKGTWMIKMKITDSKVWEAVKAGKYKGFSIEGNFIDKQDLEDIEKDKALIDEIMNILNN